MVEDEDERIGSSKWMTAVVAGFPAFAYMFTVGLIGFWLPLYLKHIGYSYGMLQGIASVYFMALSIGGLVAGIVTDKVRKPGVIAFIGLLGNAIVIDLMYYYTGYNTMLLLRVFQGLSLSTAIPVALGSLSHIAGKSRGVGLTSLFMASGMSIGSLMGGVIIHGLGFAFLFHIGAFISGVAALVSLSIKVPGLEKARPRILEGLSHLTIRVKAVIIGIFLRQVFATGVYAILAPLFKEILHLTLLETAIALAINPFVQGTLSLPLSRLLHRKGPVMYSLGIALTSGVFVLIYIAYDIGDSSVRVLLSFAAMALQGLAFALVNISGNYIIISDLPVEIRYTASSIFNLFFNLGWIAGTLTAGAYMKSHPPITWLPIASAGVLVVGALVCVLACIGRHD